jgi:hypothetical protein
MLRVSIFLCVVVKVQLVCNCVGILGYRTRLFRVWIGYYAFLEGKAFEINSAS